MARASHRDVGVVAALERGTPHEEVVAYAEEPGVDLVVTGTRGRSGIDRVLLGSVTENVVRRSTGRSW